MAAANEAVLDSCINLDELLQLESGAVIGVMNSNIAKLTDILFDAYNKGFDKINRLTML
jgi:hypothetical protein